MTTARTIVRGAMALLGEALSVGGPPRDGRVENGRMPAVASFGSIPTRLIT